MTLSHRWLALSAVVCCATVCACDKKTPPSPPSVEPPPSGETINGSERIGWDQTAADSAELAAIRYALYVDNSRAELANVSCLPSASGPFACAARLPSLTVGAHTLELASFIVDGSVLESAKSAPLRVVVAAALTDATPSPSAAMHLRESTVTTRDGVRFHFQAVADAIDRPVDIAFAPDGRVFVAERGGRIRILNGSASSAPPAASDRVLDEGQLLALAADPQFARNHYVYSVAVVSAGSRPMFSLARFRETSNTFGDRVILLDGLPATSPDPCAALRFGPDGALLVAFDDGGDPLAAGDLSSMRGKVLRLNTDGSTPADQAGATPLYAFGFHAPRAIAWHAQSDTMWIAERGGTIAAVERDGSRNDRKTRGVTRQTYALPEAIAPSAMAFFHDTLLVASENGSLLRVRFDPLRPTTVIAAEPLMRDEIGPVRLVGVGIDGTIYVGTNDSVGRLVRQ